MMAPASCAASNQGHREVRVGFDGRRERAGQVSRLLGDRLARVTRVSAERVPGTPDDPHKCDAVEKHKACSATQGFAGARLLTHRAKGGIYGPENAGARRITRPAARSGTVVSGRNRGMTAVARCINPASSPSARACEAIRSTGGEAGIRTREQGLSPVNGLANRRFRPLSHLSAKLHAGRESCSGTISADGVTVKRLCNHHLTYPHRRSKSGEIGVPTRNVSPRSMPLMIMSSRH